MKKLLIVAAIVITLSLIVIVITLPGRSSTSKTEIEDVEAYCTSFGEVCSQDSQDKNVCEICGITKASSYASCHSKEFCENAPME